MILELLAVGKPRSEACNNLVDDYMRRLRAFGLTLREQFVAEVRAGGQYSAEHARIREGRALLALSGSASACRIVLDPLGQSMDSRSLAKRLGGCSRPCALFLIGGPGGHSDEVRKQADVTWSLSRLTFPHELARVLLWEQLYRAVTLQRGIPYHK